MGPILDIKDKIGTYETNKKTYAGTVVKDDKNSKDIEIQIKELKIALQQSIEENLLIKKQYDECEKTLVKMTEEFEKVKSELKDLKVIIRLEKEIEETNDEIKNKESQKTFNKQKINDKQEKYNKNTENIIECRNAEQAFKSSTELEAHREKEHNTSSEINNERTHRKRIRLP